METITNFLFGDFLVYGMDAASYITFGVTLFLYVFREKWQETISEKLLYLGVSFLGFQFFYALVGSWGQYVTWASDEFSKLFLPPHQPISYFLGYVGQRMWLEVFIGLAVALFFYWFLVRLKKYNGRFFQNGEVALGFVVAIVSGWPGFVIFVPFAFLSVIVVSLFRLLFLQEKYTTLGYPFLLALVFTLAYGDKVIDLLYLGVLRV